MNPSWATLRINPERFRANFEKLAAIGATADGGVHRPALSPAHQEARGRFLDQARQAGLETSVDGAGNHSALLRCGRPDSPTLLLGSHLDSVPYGGRFDGALGVVAALEVLQVAKEREIPLRTHLEAIDFTDEEGHFVGLLGSQALSGQLKVEHLQDPRGGRERFQQALQRAGLSEGSLLAAKRDPSTVASYLELHIEQGDRLINRDAQIGIVTSIVGIRSFWLKFVGRADHAGTTPMDKRLDAAQGASAFTLAARELVTQQFPGCVVNVGDMAFEPAAFNVVPQAVTVSLEFRADDEDQLDQMEAALLEQASLEAARFRLGLETTAGERVAPAQMHGSIRAAFSRASAALGLRQTHLPSGAGHDAQSMARFCPSGMIFIPSAGGFSHSPREFSEWEDCVNGANTLLQAALLLAQ